MAELSDLDWLRVHFDRVLTERDARYAAERKADKDAVRVAHENAEKAIGTAALEAKERLAAHNGLIDKMEKQALSFIPREVADERFRHLEEWRAKMTGAILLLAAIGVGNLVKLWLS